MNQFIGLLSILILFLPGYLLVTAITNKRNILESISAGYLVGVQLFTIIIFIAHYNQSFLTPFSGWTYLIAITVLVLILQLVLNKNINKTSSIKSDKLTMFTKTLLILSILIVTSNLFVSNWFPVTDWDAVTLFDYRATIILKTNQLIPSFERASFLSYPYLTTLLHWWMRVNGASSPMPIYSLFYLFYLINLLYLFRRKYNLNISIMFTTLLMGVSKMFEHSLIAYSNFPYSIYLILGVFYLYYWTEDKNKSDLIIGILLSILSCWARSFPFFIANLLVLFLLPIVKKYLKQVLISLAIISLIFGIMNFNILIKLLPIIDYLKWSIFKYYIGYWIIYLISLFIQIRTKNINYFWNILIILYVLILIVGSYIYSIQDPLFAIIPDTIQRTFMFIPSILMISSINSNEDYN